MGHDAIKGCLAGVPLFAELPAVSRVAWCEL